MDTHHSENLEFKAQLDSVLRTEVALRAIGAVDAGILVQRDTYFRVASGRLKLREMPDRAELIEYDRNEAATEMLSRYAVTPIERPRATRDELAGRYGVRGVVEKSRSLWLYKNARIHLDHVGGLGTFLELEVVEPRTPEEGRALLYELIDALSLDSTVAIQGSYIDLLETGTGLRRTGGIDTMVAPSASIQADEIKAHVELAMDRWSVPGVAIGVLQNGEVKTWAFGIANRETGQPVMPATLFQVGSISKVFTATLIMQLVDNGLVDLDTSVKSYLPSLKLADESATGTVTLRHLLTHTAGFYGDRFDDFGSGDDALSRSIASFDTLRQYTPPGDLWAYCNTGFQLAGAVVESLLATTFEDAMRQRILGPLGLEQTFYHPHEVITRPHAVGHNTISPTGDERPLPPEIAREWGRSRCRAAQGGISSTVADLLHFAAFHMGDGTAQGVRVLSHEALVAMRTPLVVAALASHWGIGWSVDSIDGVAVIGHSGTTNGFQARLTLVPERDVAFACLTNSNLGAAAIQSIADHLLTRLTGLVRTDPPRISLPLGRLAAFAGRYERPDVTATISATDGGLLVEIGGKNPITKQDMTLPPRRAVPVGERTFLLTEGEFAGSTFDFIENADNGIRFLRFGGRLSDRVE